MWKVRRKPDLADAQLPEADFRTTSNLRLARHSPKIGCGAGRVSNLDNGYRCRTGSVIDAERQENSLTGREAVGLALRKCQLDKRPSRLDGQQVLDSAVSIWITLIHSKSFTFVFTVTRVADSTPRIWATWFAEGS